MNYPIVGLGAVCMWMLVTVAAGHPDHTATQKKVIEIVPATEPAVIASEVKVDVVGAKRVVTANGVPDHATGRFPNRNNPHGIKVQSYRYEMPAKPVRGETPVPLGRQPFGIAVNGVLFDPGTAEAWGNDRASGWSYEAKGGGFSLGLDANNAHVQPNGAYHYHGIPTGLLEALSGGKAKMVQVGWAADGFPIYAKWGYARAEDPRSAVKEMKSSYRLKKGERPTTGGQPGGRYDGVFVEDYEYVAGSGDLDECGGRFGVTAEFPQGTYYYVLTEDYPFVPRMFRGPPDASFQKRGPGGRRPPM